MIVPAAGGADEAVLVDADPAKGIRAEVVDAANIPFMLPIVKNVEATNTKDIAIIGIHLRSRRDVLSDKVPAMAYHLRRENTVFLGLISCLAKNMDEQSI
jgi:hypothetical protein